MHSGRECGHRGRWPPVTCWGHLFPKAGPWARRVSYFKPLTTAKTAGSARDWNKPGKPQVDTWQRKLSVNVREGLDEGGVREARRARLRGQCVPGRSQTHRAPTSCPAPTPRPQGPPPALPPRCEPAPGIPGPALPPFHQPAKRRPLASASCEPDVPGRPRVREDGRRRPLPREGHSGIFQEGVREEGRDSAGERRPLRPGHHVPCPCHSTCPSLRLSQPLGPPLLRPGDEAHLGSPSPGPVSWLRSRPPPR